MAADEALREVTREFSDGIPELYRIMPLLYSRETRAI